MTYTRELEIILTLLDFFISLGVEVYVDTKCCDFSASPIANQVRERRRSRSRSRHRIESELAKRFQEIPAVNDTYEYLVSAYTLIKDSNPLVKESLQRSEDLAFWMRDKTEQVLSATRLDQPLKAMDANAARTLEEMENIRTKVKIFLKDSVEFIAFTVTRKCILHSTVCKNEKFTLTQNFPRQINYLVILLVKSLLSRNFCQKFVRGE